MMFEINYIWMINCCLPWLFITMIESRSFKAPDSVSGVEIMNTTHRSNKKRKINETSVTLDVETNFSSPVFRDFFYKKETGRRNQTRTIQMGKKMQTQHAWLIRDNVEVPIVVNIRINQWNTSFCICGLRAKVIWIFFLLASKSNKYRCAKDWL